VKLATTDLESLSDGIVRTWKSPKFDPEPYRNATEVNCIAEYRLIYLKQLKLVTSAARPSLFHPVSMSSK
jgi:hypothetical protein